MVAVHFNKIAPHALVPRKHSARATGFDLHSLEPGIVHAGGRMTFRTGIAVSIPDGFEGQVRPRSGLARNFGVHAVFGSIDGDFRGEIGVTLLNTSPSAFHVKEGDRIAQLVITVLPAVDLVEVDELDATERGAGGFGSTGIGGAP